MAVFSMPTNESELEAELEELIAENSESSVSFASIQEEFNASSAISSSASFDENDESTTMRVGPTIFERLWALRQYSREEQIRDSIRDRMYPLSRDDSAHHRCSTFPRAAGRDLRAVGEEATHCSADSTTVKQNSCNSHSMRACTY